MSATHYVGHTSVGLMEEFVGLGLRLFVPVPGVLERLDLRRARHALG